MRWFLKVLFYNTYNFVEKIKFGNAEDAASQLMPLILSLDIFVVIAVAFYQIQGYLVDALSLGIMTIVVVLIGKFLFYNPALGKNRWKKVVTDERYGSPFCRSLALIWALANLGGCAAFCRFIISLFYLT